MVQLDIFLGSNLDKEAFTTNSANNFKNLIPENLQERISNSRNTHFAVNRVYSYGLSVPRFLINLRGCLQSEIGGGERGSLVSCQKTFSQGSFTHREEEEVYRFSPPQFHQVNLRHHSIFAVNLSGWHGEELVVETDAVIIIHATLKFEENKMADLKKAYFLTLKNDKGCQFNSQYLNQPINLASGDEVGVSTLTLPKIPNIRPPFNYIDVVFNPHIAEGATAEQKNKHRIALANYRENVGKTIGKQSVPWYSVRAPDSTPTEDYTKRVHLKLGHYKTLSDLVDMLNSAFAEAFIDPWWWSIPNVNQVLDLKGQLYGGIVAEEKTLGSNFTFSQIEGCIVVENRSDLTAKMFMKEKLAKILGLPIILTLDSAIDNILENREEIQDDGQASRWLSRTKAEPQYGLPKFVAACSPIASHSFIGNQMHKILCLFLLPEEDKGEEGGYSIMIQHLKFINTNPGIFNNMELVFYDAFEGPIDFGEKESKTFISFFVK